MWEKYLAIKKGCESIGYVEIDAYQRLTGAELEPWQVDLMLELDVVRRNNG